jgi:cytochrome d ubiquinol oxidase subunit II
MALKTTGEVGDRAAASARRLAPLTGLVVLVFASWTHYTADKGFFPNVVEIAAVLAIFAAVWLIAERRDGWAFATTTFAMATCVLAIFVDLYPHTMVSSTNASYDLTINNTSASSYSLTVMTVVAVILLPVVILYQAWTYHVFRQRISSHDFAGERPDLASTPDHTT